nr:hypothetical protein [Tanacetum cinerariifolium]
MDSFQGLTPKSPSSWHQSLALNPDFYDHVSFHFKCEIDRTAGGKIRNKNPDESWEIIENLALYDHEGWNDAKEFVKPVKASSTPQPTSKTHDRRLLELEDRINFLLKGSRSTPRPSSTHVPQAYAEAFYSNTHSRNKNEPPKQSPFTFRKQRVGLLKELTTSRAPEKVPIREEAKSPVTKNVNSISLARREEERNKDNDVATGNNIEKPTITEMRMPVNEARNGIKNEPIRKAEKEATTKAPSSKHVEYYLKHRINEKLIDGLIDNHRFYDSLSRA